MTKQILNKSTPGSSESITCSSEVATVLSTPRCSTSCEPQAKQTGSVSSGPTTGCQHCSVTCTEQRANTENRSHLNRSPTAEETTAWKGARVALTPKDTAAGKSHIFALRIGHQNSKSHLFEWELGKTRSSDLWCWA